MTASFQFPPEMYEYYYITSLIIWLKRL